MLLTISIISSDEKQLAYNTEPKKELRFSTLWKCTNSTSFVPELRDQLRKSRLDEERTSHQLQKSKAKIAKLETEVASFRENAMSDFVTTAARNRYYKTFLLQLLETILTTTQNDAEYQKCLMPSQTCINFGLCGCLWSEPRYLNVEDLYTVPNSSQLII